MPRQRFENNSKSTLSVAVSSNTQASLTVQSGHGARFPYLASPDYFYVTLDDGTNVEVCKCIDRAGDVLTVLRGQEYTTAQASFATGTKVEMRLTRAGLAYLRDFAPMNVVALKPLANVASWAWFGMQLPTQVGCVTGQTLSNSGWRAGQPRIRFNQNGSAQSPILWRVPNPICNVGNGFRATYRFGMFHCPSSSHFFVGLVNTTGAVTSVHPPSSLTQAIVVGYANAGGTPNLSIWRNDASGNAVQLDLGSYFTINSAHTYEVEFRCVGSEARVDYSVRRLDVSSIAAAESYFTADIPTNSAWLSPYMEGSTMVTSWQSVDMMGFEVET